LVVGEKLVVVAGGAFGSGGIVDCVPCRLMAEPVRRPLTREAAFSSEPAQFENSAVSLLEVTLEVAGWGVLVPAVLPVVPAVVPVSVVTVTVVVVVLVVS
jgi:hypothetical protein